MSKAKPVLPQCATAAQPDAGKGMPDQTPCAQSSRFGRAGTSRHLVERLARNAARGLKGTRKFDDVNTASPPAWPERFEPAAVLKGYLDGLADTPNHTRRDEAYWYGHLSALADRQPGNGPEMGMACPKFCH
ncbi:MAG TPA: hypothetical protein VGJ72_16540 [Polaromonas sp.]